MSNELFILWTNADEITFDKMVNMYARNSILERWWDKVTIIIWGRTALLVAKSKLVQEGIKQLLHIGVNISACKACSDQLGVSGELKELGIDISYWGQGLTTILKENQKLITI
jgi:hypothetical protein